MKVERSIQIEIEGASDDGVTVLRLQQTLNKLLALGVPPTASLGFGFGRPIDITLRATWDTVEASG